MSIARMINRECVILRRTASSDQDEYGDEIPETIEIETVCEIQKQKRIAEETPAEISDTRWSVFFLAGEEVGSGDRLRTVDDDLTYEIEGDPWRVRNPRTQQVSHIEATARRTSGPGVGGGGS